MNPITGTTQIFGLLAHPIHHVKTPALLNQIFRERRSDAVMVPIHVKSDGLAPLTQALRQIHNLGGLVVTVPHKTAMMALCDDVTPDARQIGAVNVVRRTPDGRWLGAMLDGEGFVAGLRREGIEPAGRSVYLAGAGGAASAIAFALVSAGVTRLTIANRTLDKAQRLIDRLAAVRPGLHLRLGSDDPSNHDLVVNSTSLGLHPGDPLPLDVRQLTAAQIVADIIMQPAQTPLLGAALERGCQIHFGAPMLQAQIELMASYLLGAA